VLVILSLPAAARAQHPAGHASGHANNSGMAQQQKAMEAQMRQQQRAMEAQFKQQQQAMQQQQKAMMQQQQKAMQQQHKAMQQQAVHEQKAMAAQQHQAAKPAASSAHAAHHASATNHAKTATTHHVAVTHHWLRIWPHHTSPAYAHMQSLKRHLDQIAALKTPATAAQKGGLKNALSNVIENSPHPSAGHMQTFANHLADAIVNRTPSQLNTQELALQLRAMVNNVHMSPAELDATLTQHQSLMLGSGVNPQHVGALSDDLRFLVAETQSKASLR
jgi:hypothetical protein